MALSIFDQRPKQFKSYGYPFSKFVQTLELQGFAEGALVTAALWAYNANDVPSQLAGEALQPVITIIDESNRLLTLTSAKTGQLTDPAYWLEYRVDDTVYGGTRLVITRELPLESDALLTADKILLSVGTATRILLRDPEADAGATFNYSVTPAVNAQFIQHNLNTDLLDAYAYTAAGVRRTDVAVIPLRGEAGKDFRNWAYLFLPPTTDADDRVTDLIIKPIYR